MQIVPDEVTLQAPSICFICETSPDRGYGVRVIDTFREFVPGPVTRLNGRKYVCENCIKEFSRLLGFVPEDEIRSAKVALEDARGRFAQFQQDIIASARGIETEVNAFGSLPMIETPTTALEPTLLDEARREVAKETEKEKQ